MHYYQPRVHLVRADDVADVPFSPVLTFTIPHTRFIAVTAYQNNKVSGSRRANEYGLTLRATVSAIYHIVVLFRFITLFVVISALILYSEQIKMISINALGNDYTTTIRFRFDAFRLPYWGTIGVARVGSQNDQCPFILGRVG